MWGSFTGEHKAIHKDRHSLLFSFSTTFDTQATVSLPALYDFIPRSPRKLKITAPPSTTEFPPTDPSDFAAFHVAALPCSTLSHPFVKLCRIGPCMNTFLLIALTGLGLAL